MSEHDIKGQAEQLLEGRDAVDVVAELLAENARYREQAALTYEKWRDMDWLAILHGPANGHYSTAATIAAERWGVSRRWVTKLYSTKEWKY